MEQQLPPVCLSKYRSNSQPTETEIETILMLSFYNQRIREEVNKSLKINTDGKPA